MSGVSTGSNVNGAPTGTPSPTPAPAQQGDASKDKQVVEPPNLSDDRGGFSKNLIVDAHVVDNMKGILDSVRLWGSLPYARAHGVLGTWMLSVVPGGLGANSKVVDTTSNAFWRGSYALTSAEGMFMSAVNGVIAVSNLAEGMHEAHGPQGAVTTNAGRTGMIYAITPSATVGAIGLITYRAIKSHQAAPAIASTMLQKDAPSAASVDGMLADPKVTSDPWALRTAHLVAITRASQSDDAIQELTGVHTPKKPSFVGRTMTKLGTKLDTMRLPAPLHDALSGVHNLFTPKLPVLSDADQARLATLTEHRDAMNTAAQKITDFVTLQAKDPDASTVFTSGKLARVLAKQKPEIGLVDDLVDGGSARRIVDILKQSQTSPLRAGITMSVIGAAVLPLVIANEAGYFDFMNTGSDHRSLMGAIEAGNHNVKSEALQLSGIGPMATTVHNVVTQHPVAVGVGSAALIGSAIAMHHYQMGPIKAVTALVSHLRR